MKVTREQLYKEVWAEPMTTVAKRYEVSSNYLARICERLNIPRPGRGFWQQRAVGAEVEVEPLPGAQPGDEIEWARDGSRPATAPMSSKSPRLWKSDAERPAEHPLVEGSRGHFDDVRPGYEKVYVIPRKSKLVDVFVTRATLGRALRLASELFLFLEDRGQRVVFAAPPGKYRRAPVEVREGAKPNQDYSPYDRGRWEPTAPTVALVGDVVIGVTIFETMGESDSIYRDGKYVRYEPPREVPSQKRRRFAVPDPRPYVTKHWLPTGRLGIHAYAAEQVAWEQTWIEKAAGDLAAIFEDIAKAFERAAPKIESLLVERRLEMEKRDKEYEEQRKRWQREEVERRRKEEEVAREKQLLQDITSWRLARDIRAFVAETTQLVGEANCTITEGGQLDQSLQWALAYAESVDPLRTLRDDIRRVHSTRDARRPADAADDGAKATDTSGELPAGESPFGAPQ